MLQAFGLAGSSSRRYLPVRPVEPDGVVVRSHQMLDRALRPGATVADLIALMDDPPYPPEELCERQWEHVRYGRFQIEYDVSVA
jgi:hypothetical protein